jgi:Rrf2 family iron-sulfur cluster assembly transcriptional regulator
MFSLYSKKCEYVLRGLARLGKGSDQKRFRAADFCRDFDLPEPFTRKALQELVRVGILQAIQGPGGGYSFAKSPESITVLEVIKAVEGEDHFDSCVMGFHECDADKPCGMHAMWVQLKGKLIHQLEEETLDSLMKESSRKSAGKKRLGKKSC